MKIALCLPTHGAAYRSHELSLRALDKQGHEWTFLALDGNPNLNIARGAIAEDALLLGADVALWVDGDVSFEPGTPARIAKCALEADAVVGAVYLEKRLGGSPRVDFLPETKHVTFYEGGGMLEVEKIGFGLVAHPVSMLERIAQKTALETSFYGDKPIRHWFTSDPRWHEFHSDDFAFCRRARDAGFKIFADTSERIVHHGEHGFVLEDMRPRKLAVRLEAPLAR